MHLSDALLVWLDANTEQMDCSIRTKENLTEILKEVCIDVLGLNLGLEISISRVGSGVGLEG